MSLVILADIAVLLLLLYVAGRLILSRRGPPLPPGPPRLPLLGNVRDWPSEHEWLTFTEWGNKYGNLVYAELLGKPVVIVNSPDLAHEILERKGAMYAGRPSRPMMELATVDQSVGASQYEPRHRALRALVMKTVWGNANAARYSETMERHSRRFLRRLLNHPTHVLQCVEKFSASFILDMVYGYEVADGEDQMVQAVLGAAAELPTLVAPKAFVVDALPFLRYLPQWTPGASFHRAARRARDCLTDIRTLPFEWTRNQMATGTYRQSFTADHLSNPEITAEEEALVRLAGASLFFAGFDTTMSALYTFFLAMTLHPEVQKRAHGEIMEKLGNERLPILADREHLPYVTAVVKEVLRWQPIAPQALPHKALEEDVQSGYRVPKNTMVIPNIWGFLHDSDIYSDPDTFNPERFLNITGYASERDPTDFVFGFGRRLCPGMHLAQANLFVAIAQTLAVMSIEQVCSADGHPIVPEINYSSGIVVKPKEFPCKVVPRTKQLERLLQSPSTE